MSSRGRIQTPSISRVSSLLGAGFWPGHVPNAYREPDHSDVLHCRIVPHHVMVHGWIGAQRSNQMLDSRNKLCNILGSYEPPRLRDIMVRLTPVGWGEIGFDSREMGLLRFLVFPHSRR